MKRFIITAALIAASAFLCNAQKYMALSFDDGPNTTTTNEVLDVLEANGIAGSFFVIGRNINKETAVVMRRAIALGCDIENHSSNHPYMSKLTDDAVKSEIEVTDNLIRIYTGTVPEYFRPPYIDQCPSMHQVIDKTFIAGYSCHDWQSGMSAEEKHKLIMQHAADGLIILLHDFTGNKTTVEALRTAIPALKEQGYTFVSVPELFRVKGVAHPHHNGKVYSNVLK